MRETTEEYDDESYEFAECCICDNQFVPCGNRDCWGNDCCPDCLEPRELVRE